MGCAQILPAGRRSSKASVMTIDSTESNEDKFARIKQRDGHPSFYKTDGYTFGLRVKVRSNMQTIFMASSRSSGEKVTLKEFHLANCDENQVIEEIATISQFNHDCLPRIREVFLTNFSVYAIMDYIDTMRLQTYIDFRNRTTTLSMEDSRCIFESVMSAVHHCHGHKIIIRNLVPSNIMVRKICNTVDGKVQNSYEVKIVDFSQAVEFGSRKFLLSHPLFDWADMVYMAPEALLNHDYTCSMDIWSAAVVLYVMLSGEMPFVGVDDESTMEHIKAAEYSFSATKWDMVDHTAKDLIDRCLVVRESDRYRTLDILTHPWVRG